MWAQWVPFHQEMQRIGGNAQSPLQLARVDDSVDENFDPEVMIEVIERGSAVHCVSAYEAVCCCMGTRVAFQFLAFVFHGPLSGIQRKSRRLMETICF